MLKPLTVLALTVFASAAVVLYASDRKEADRQQEGDEGQPEQAVQESKEKPSKARTEKFSSRMMKKKLETAQQILGALSTEDYEAIAKHAKDLGSLGALEQWLYADTPEYKAQLNIYQFAAGELARLAEDKNLDGAALAYVQLTLSCVNCHKHVRKQGK